ncbi:hypothetical protein [Hymenobacter armeniacus]|uniref:hypothetical protein n=1 Tax=Hymenobacter armeniacus TaxID=2771358 RepID=UPI00293B8A85|nr:hypothetical protein [Hymenobacter armeniacus]
MKPFFTALFVTVLNLLLGISGYAQQPKKTVTGDLAHVPFEEFARQLEAQSS